MATRRAAPLSNVAPIVIVLVLWAVVFGLVVSPYLMDVPAQTATSDGAVVWVPSGQLPALP